MKFFGLEIKRSKKPIKVETEKEVLKQIKYSETKRINDQIKDMERQIFLAEKELELESLQNRLEDYYEDDTPEETVNNEDPLTAALTNIVTPILQQKLGGGIPSTPPPSQNPVVDLSDEQIRELISNLKNNDPKALQMAKKFPEAQVKDYMKSNYNFSENTSSRALEMIKNG